MFFELLLLLLKKLSEWATEFKTTMIFDVLTFFLVLTLFALLNFEVSDGVKYKEGGLGNLDAHRAD